MGLISVSALQLCKDNRAGWAQKVSYLPWQSKQTNKLVFKGKQDQQVQERTPLVFPADACSEAASHTLR